MSNGLPSINDLITNNHSMTTNDANSSVFDLDSNTAKFSQKMQSLKIKDLEKQTMQSATIHGLPYMDLSIFPIAAEALKIIPETLARAKKIVCFYYTPDEIRIGAVEPLDPNDDFIYQLSERHHARVVLFLISQHSLEKACQLYSILPIVKPINKDIDITDADLNKFGSDINNLQDLQTKFKNVSITDVLTLLIAAAIKVGSSDVHVEAEENGVAVRYRIDGVLHEAALLPKESWKKFISRIKLLSALKINISDRPQDGRVTLKLASGDLDVRVSIIPTTYGESVVMRILHGRDQSVSFENLGLRGEVFEILKKEMRRPNGMIITTGPTGSGKTTTLYSILQVLNKPGVKIITLEDPVEIKMPGINQSQVDPTHDYTFAKGLRSILRQDPDICMVGEIRDLESAEIAIQAALTGHLMLSTIHTNSAAGAIPRFLSMGVKPFLLAPALNAVVSQRLVRRICPHCVEEALLNNETKEKVETVLRALPDGIKQHIDWNNLHFYHGRGCAACSGLGYKGRVGIYEIFTMNKELENIILSTQISEYAVQSVAIQNGMVTMAQDGLLKALDKITSVEEVLRVTE